MLHISESGEKVALRVWDVDTSRWVWCACACMPLRGHVSLFVCRAAGCIPPTWRATRADGVPKVQRLADGDGSRREVRREGLAGLEGRASIRLGDSCNTSKRRSVEFTGGRCRWEPSLSRPESRSCCFFALLSRIPCELGRLPKRQTGN